MLPPSGSVEPDGRFTVGDAPPNDRARRVGTYDVSPVRSLCALGRYIAPSTVLCNARSFSVGKRPRVAYR